jgi:hypothetical protein
MVSFSVATQVYDLVLLCLRTSLAKVIDIVFEPLPLRLCALWIVLGVCGIRAIKQS